MDDGGETTGRGQVRRPYRSPRREQQARRTRARILAAAHAEFLARGWAGTTMRSVATAAEVSLPTLELAFGTKARLLAQVIDVAIAGDDEPVAVLDRDTVAAAAARKDVGDFLRAVADILATAQQRSARLVLVAFEAAAADPALRQLVSDRITQRATMAEWITDGMLRRAPLHAGMDRAEAVDVVWLLMDPVVFVRLTEDRGWPVERYREWFADSARRLVLAVAAP